MFPANAKGPFRLRMTAKLDVPADGDYRFYAKIDEANRVKVYLARREIISPANRARHLSVAQPGMKTHRIDFSRPVSLKKGLTDLTVIYEGDEVRKIHNTHMVRISGLHHAGIQLFWSSDCHLTERVPATALFRREVRGAGGAP